MIPRMHLVLVAVSVLWIFLAQSSLGRDDRSTDTLPKDNSLKRYRIDEADLIGVSTEDALRLLIDKIPADAEWVDLCGSISSDVSDQLLRFKHLKRLEVGGPDASPGTELCKLSVLPIESLFLRGDNSTRKLVQCLADFKRLKNLNLCIPGRVVYCEDLSRLKSLEQLRCCPGGNLSLLRECKHLKHLQIEFDYGFYSQPVPKVVFNDWRMMDRLQELCIGRNYGYPGSDSKRPMTKEDFKQIRKLQSLRFLDVSGMMLGDDDMDAIAKLGSLERLNLSGNPVTDAGIARLNKLHHLKALTVRDTGVTDGGFAFLAELPDLEELDVIGTSTNGSLLKYLPRKSKLCNLTLAAIQNQNLELLAGAPNLHYLCLRGATVNEFGAVQISKLNKLTSVSLGSISSQALQSFQKMPSLKYMWIDPSLHPAVDEKDLAALLPGCQFVYSFRDLEDYNNILIHGRHETTSSWTCF